jgi:L-asparaginase II
MTRGCIRLARFGDGGNSTAAHHLGILRMRRPWGMVHSLKVDGAPTGLLVEVRRGSYLESVHRVWACAMRANGELLYASGDVEQAFPIRSLAKPFIAAELVRSGAADEFGLGDVELALASGSHDGEERHIAAVRGFLTKIGVSEDMLLCGPAMEGKRVVGPPVASNCSGKHAAVLALCQHVGAPIENYIAADHPVQRSLRQTLLRTFSRTATNAPIVTDGCSMPIFGASLREMAAAYAGLGESRDAAVMRVRSAIAAEPGYFGGWQENLDTEIVTWTAGSIVGKIGAEGLHADALVGHGTGFAIKVLGGNSRAFPPVLAELFSLFARGAVRETHVKELAEPVLTNAAGRGIGELRLTLRFTSVRAETGAS